MSALSKERKEKMPMAKAGINGTFGYGLAILPVQIPAC